MSWDHFVKIPQTIVFKNICDINLTYRLFVNVEFHEHARFFAYSSRDSRFNDSTRGRANDLKWINVIETSCIWLHSLWISEAGRRRIKYYCTSAAVAVGNVEPSVARWRLQQNWLYRGFCKYLFTDFNLGVFASFVMWAPNFTLSATNKGCSISMD